MSRLALPLYVYGCPNNLLHTKPQPWLCLGLCLWLGCQVRSGLCSLARPLHCTDCESAG